MNKFSAAVIGLGQIGLGYDYDCQDSSILLTHSAALNFHDGFELVAAVDPDPEKRRKFEKKNSRPAYAALEDLHRSHGTVEVYTVGVPTLHHHSACEAILGFGPRALLCEKPFTGQVSLAKDLIQKAQQRQCLLAVNYNRRFIPAMETLKRDIEADRFGSIYKGTLYYTKGIRHNGSHFIDLLGYLLGEMNDVKVIEPGRELAHGDWEPDLVARFGNATIHILAGREECYYMGEFDLVGTRGKIKFVDGEPIRIYEAAGNPLFPSEKSLGSPICLENPSTRAIYYTLDNLYLGLTQGALLKSTGSSALQALKALEKITAKIRECTR